MCFERSHRMRALSIRLQCSVGWLLKRHSIIQLRNERNAWNQENLHKKNNQIKLHSSNQSRMATWILISMQYEHKLDPLQT